VTGVPAEPENGTNPVVEHVLVGDLPARVFEVVFSQPMQLASPIEDGSIVEAIQLTHYRTGLVPLSARDFSVGGGTQSLVRSAPAPLPPGFYELQLDGAALLDTEGNALLGGQGGLSFQIPEFAGEATVDAEGAPIMVDSYSVPTLADWNGDGIQDLIVGEQTPSGGKIRLYLNNGTNPLPQYNAFTYVQYDGSDLTVPCSGCLGVYPRVFDWNEDGRQDFVLGLADGRIQVYPNVQSNSDPVFGAPHYLQVGQPGAKEVLTVGMRATFEIVDWNNDGRHDLITGGLDGKVGVYLNFSEGGEPDLRDLAVVQDASGDLIVPTGRSSVAVADLNGDGRKDLLLGNTEGRLIYYANVGTDASPAFATGQAIQAGGIEIDLAGTPRSRPDVVDYDADGLPDLLVGSADGLVRLYRAGSWTTPYVNDAVWDEAGTLYRHVFQVAAATWQNGVEPTDVTADGRIVPLDALTILNELNSSQYADPVGLLPLLAPDAPPPFFDVNGDGYCTPIDALLVINRLNAAAAVPTGQTTFAARGIIALAIGGTCSDIAAAIDCLLADDHAHLTFLPGDDPDPE
jgi:hypothetical protein